MKNSNSFLDRFRTRLALLFCLMPAVCWLPGNVYALDPNRTLSQYVRERWGSDRGFPRGPVYAIEQTTDGLLWIGTEAGLVRFDGLNFSIVKSTDPDMPPLTHVLGLLSQPDGSIWARLRRPSATLVRYDRSGFLNPMVSLGNPQPSVAALARTSGGDPLLWLLRRETLGVVVRNGKMETVATPVEFTRSPTLAVAQTVDGSIWVGTRDAGLFRFRGGQAAVRDGLPDLKVNTLVADGNQLWVGTDGGIVRWDGSKLTRAGIPHSLDGVQVLTMTLDHHKNLWLGTNSQGLVRLNAAGAEWMDGPERQNRDALTAVFEDREGNLWTASGQGLERVRDSAFISYSTMERLPSDTSGPVFADAHHRVWFSPITGGLWWMRDGQLGQIRDAGLDQDVVYSLAGGRNGLWVGRQKGGLTHLRPAGDSFAATTYSVRDGLSQNSVYSVFESSDGTIWAGTLSGGVNKFSQGRFTTYTSTNGLASNTVASILESSDGHMWFATPNGLSTLWKDRWRSYTTADGLPSENVNCLLQDSAGLLWIGTSSGIALYDGTRPRVPAALPPVLRAQVLGIEEDKHGSLWISTATHAIRVTREKLMRGTLAEGDLREYALADGLRGMEGVKRHRSVVRDGRGRIWFSLNRGISVVDPGQPIGSSAPAIANVEAISADGRAFNPNRPVLLPGGTGRVVFKYAGVSLSAPERVRFRYKLDGFDRDWNDPVSVREAVYTNLAPNSYRFRVMVSNPDGDWNTEESSLQFEIATLLSQTLWFRAAVLFGLAGIAAGLYRYRLHRMKHALNVRFEERLAERTRIAQELHDTLLQGFISASMQLHVVAKRVPEDSPAHPSLSRVMRLMGNVIEEGRNAVRGLRITDSYVNDLAKAFTAVREELGGDLQSDFRVTVNGEPRAFHPVLRDEIYRIGREALANAFRHSQAKNIEIELSYARKDFRCLVRDDGTGIDVRVLQSGRDGHWGLRGMRERAEKIGGKLSVRSSALTGTEVELSVPAPIAFQNERSNGWIGRLAQRLGRAGQAKAEHQTTAASETSSGDRSGAS